MATQRVPATLAYTSISSGIPRGVAIRFMASIVRLRRPLRRSRTRTASQFRRQRLAVALVDEPASMAVESYPPFLAFKKLASFRQIAPARPLTIFAGLCFRLLA